MRGKQAKNARKMVADALPVGAVDTVHGRMSRGRFMRALTKYENQSNGSKSVRGQIIKLNPSVVLHHDSPRHIYQKMSKHWVKTRADYVS